MIAGNATPSDARTMWKPSVNAIWLRAASSCEAANTMVIDTTRSCGFAGRRHHPVEVTRARATTVRHHPGMPTALRFVVLTVATFRGIASAGAGAPPPVTRAALDPSLVSGRGASVPFVEQ